MLFRSSGEKCKSRYHSRKKGHASFMLVLEHALANQSMGFCPLLVTIEIAKSQHNMGTQEDKLWWLVLILCVLSSVHLLLMSDANKPTSALSGSIAIFRRVVSPLTDVADTPSDCLPDSLYKSLSQGNRFLLHHSPFFQKRELSTPLFSQTLNIPYIFNYLWIWLAWETCTWVQVPRESGERCWVPWSWSYR